MKCNNCNKMFSTLKKPDLSEIKDIHYVANFYRKMILKWWDAAVNISIKCPYCHGVIEKTKNDFIREGFKMNKPTDKLKEREWWRDEELT